LLRWEFLALRENRALLVLQYRVLLLLTVILDFRALLVLEVLTAHQAR
jgi:hypothetical protein